MKHLKLSIAIWKEDKYFVAQCLNVNVSSFGKTKKEALKNINEALDLYFEDSPVSKINEFSNPEIVTQDFQYA
jgi:predicted RNase H-like HicB family nuclease